MKKKQVLTMTMVVMTAVISEKYGILPVKAEEHPTITWYAVGNLCDSEERISEAGTKLLNDAGIDVDFEVKWLGWDNYDQTISNMIVSGEEFDIFNRDIATINNYAINGGIYEITEEDLTNKLSSVVDAMGNDIIDACRYNGALYATPVAHEFAQWRGVYYNTKIAEDCGIDMSTVKSIDDLDAVFAKVKEMAPDIYPVDTVNSENILMVMADLDDINRSSDLCMGMDISGDVSGIFNPYENEKVVAALKKIREWNEEGYVFTDTTADASALFWNEGQIFCRIARMKPGTVEQYSVGNCKFDKVLFDENAVRTFCDFPGGWGNAISATSDNPEAAMQVLNFAYGNKEFIDLLTFGEKDVDYTSDENGVITVGQSGYGAQVYGSACWQMGNHYINSVTDVQVAAGLSDIGNVLKDFNNNATSTEHTGFYFNPSEYSAEVSAIASTCLEYKVTVLSGEADVDEILAEFNEALAANGLQTLLDAANNQYQDFLETKEK